MLAATDQIWEIAILAAPDDDGGGKGYFFIIVFIVLAIQHIAEKLKAKRAAEVAQKLETSDSEGWEEEGYQDPAPTSETLLDFFRSVHQPKPEPVVAPPPPPPAKPAPRATIVAPTVSPPQDNLTHGRTHRQRLQSSTEHSTLGRMLRHPASLRNAFILKEVLDPPIAARENQSPHDI
jgi:hypothetical protein